MTHYNTAAGSVVHPCRVPAQISHEYGVYFSEVDSSQSLYAKWWNFT